MFFNKQFTQFNYNFWMVTVVSFFLGCLPAKADLIQKTDPNFGANSLTFDTQSGLTWLNVGASADLSYNQVLADMGQGGIFSGFRYATEQEVFRLLSDAGISGTGYYLSPSIPSFISTVGPSAAINGHPGIIGLSGTSFYPGTINAVNIYFSGVVDGTQEFLVQGGPGYDGGPGYGPDYSYPTIGSWLVMNVPEPADATIYLVAGAGLLIFKYLRRPRPSL